MFCWQNMGQAGARLSSIGSKIRAVSPYNMSRVQRQKHPVHPPFGSHERGDLPIRFEGVSTRNPVIDTASGQI